MRGSNKAGPGFQTEQHSGRAGLGLAGGHPWVPPPPQPLLPPFSGRLSCATLQASALLNLPAQGAKGTTGKSY